MGYKRRRSASQVNIRVGENNGTSVTLTMVIEADLSISETVDLDGFSCKTRVPRVWTEWCEKHKTQITTLYSHSTQKSTSKPWTTRGMGQKQTPEQEFEGAGLLKLESWRLDSFFSASAVHVWWACAYCNRKYLLICGKIWKGCRLISSIIEEKPTLLLIYCPALSSHCCWCSPGYFYVLHHGPGETTLRSNGSKLYKGITTKTHLTWLGPDTPTPPCGQSSTCGWLKEP